MNSACPMGAPRTVRPCSVGGRAGLPTQTSEPNEVRLGGGWPAPFQTLGKGRHHSVAGGHEERLLNL